MAKKKPAESRLKTYKKVAEELSVKIENKSGKHLGGRPTIYTQQLAEKFCSVLENSPRGINWICNNNPDFPTGETIRDWLRNDTYPWFSARYSRAREMQADFLSDEVIDVSYDHEPDKFGRVEKPKLMVEALKWKAKVLRPKIYGDKPELFLDTSGENPALTSKETIAEKVSKLDELIAKKISLFGDKDK